ncbi:glycosyltransferase family 2 protein [Clostridium sp.]|uniref:glycosyltransferase family 2 protein n=1 Tax=Clostridium sp. TaxID=1506 RepID=UPI00261C1062|nr:glycosyltransferase family 2 protein [Clostridium sp.]
MIDLSIIIVNWNTGDLLENCIKSIIRNTHNLRCEIIICDNDSKDNSANRGLEKYQGVKIIYSKENLGFSKGNNLAFNYAEGKYILLLNPDTIIKDKAIDKAYKYIIERNEDVLLGAKLLNSDSSIQLSSCHFPTLVNMILKQSIMSKEMHQKTHETDWVMGAFMMLSKELYIKLGKLDESYFMYSEDLDLCYQVKRLNGKVIYFSDAEVIHFYNQSGAKKWNSKRELVITESLLKFINKNYSGISKILCNFAVRSRYIIKSMKRKELL